MPISKFSGRTSLGNALNKTISKTSDSKARKTRYVYGVLKSSVDGGYRFNVLVIGRSGKFEFTVGPISMSESPQDLAARFGSPEDMVNDRLMVKIAYSGAVIQSGKATIIKDYTNLFPGGEVELAQKANDLPVQGTSFAPPGASVI